jgi:hypothetical protein
MIGLLFSSAGERTKLGPVLVFDPDSKILTGSDLPVSIFLYSMKIVVILIAMLRWEEDTYTDRDGSEHSNTCELVWEVSIRVVT